MENSEEDILNKFKVNIISWYNFRKTNSILLIGDIDKAIVSFLCEKFKKVVIILKDKAKVAELYKITDTYKNFRVMDEFFFNVEEEKFEYILLMNYFDNNKDIEIIDFMDRISNLLQVDGKILAIFKNKIGAREIAKNSFEGYSKNRLENIIKNSKCKFSKFYYVLPNEEYTNIIFSDEYLPTETDMRRNLEFSKTPTSIGFSENKILTKILKEYKNDFKILANSFFVELSKNDFINNVQAVFYSNIRNEKYQIRTKILDGIAIKEPVYESGKNHINAIKNNIDILKKCKINTLDSYDEEKIISRLAVNCERLDEKFLEFYNKNDSEYKQIISKFKKDMLFKLGKTDTRNNIFEKLNINIDNETLNKLTFVKYGLWDLTMQNVFLIEDRLYVYDQEWYEENVPLEFMLYRSILHGFEILSEEEKDKLYKEFDVYEFKELFYELELQIQKDVTNHNIGVLYANTLFASPEEILKTEKEDLVAEQNKLVCKQNELINVQNELLKKIKMQGELINSEKLINSDLKNKNELIINEKSSLIGELAVRDNKINELQVSIANSKMLKCARKIKGIEKNISEKLIKICQKPTKFLYKNVLPKKMKRKLREKAEYSKTLSKILEIPIIHSYNHTIKLHNKKNDTYQDVLSQFKLENKTIGIHLHLYYEDLAEEFYEYLCNIPYIFDLYISVRKETNINEIEKKFSRIINLDYLEVRVSENSGRDFGPMFVLFAEKLKKYDYIMHIHSKKSLRSGQEQTEWRKYLLENLLGSPEFIMKEFYLMENLNCGLVYPDAHSSLSIMSYAWLDEKELAKEILNEMGIEFKDEFLEFSAGSMFWAKKDALKQLLDLKLTWDDFGKDKKQVGGTLEYVFERIPGTVAKHNDYNIAIYDTKNNEFILNKGNKGADNYFKYTITDYINILRNFDIITFDIFDTLITRKIFEYNDIFLLIDKNISEKNIKIDNFVKLRKEAEEKLSKENNGIYTINEIYSELKNMANLKDEQVLKLKNIEIETIIKLCAPRKEVLEIYNNLISMDKKILFLCDTYLTKEIVQKILNNCGYSNYFDIWLSSEVKLQKRDGTMFDNLYSKYENSSIAHVGNDEQYDIHILVNVGRVALYTASGNRLLELSSYSLENANFDLPNSILFGLVYNNSLFNSPFSLNNNENEALVKSLFDLGYAILGPIILDYILFEIKFIKENSHNSVLLFASQEGYYLKKIYDHLKEKLKLKELENIEEYYFQISEKFIKTKTIENINDIYKLFEGEYFGTLKKALYEKLGYTENIEEDQIIELPRDFCTVKEIIDKNNEEIMNKVQYEKTNYLKYIESLVPSIYDKTPILVALNVNETYKNYFSKLINKEVVFKKYNNLENDISFSILDKFLLSPQGEFEYIDNDMNLYYSSENNEWKEKYLNQIFDGVINLMDDMIEVYGENLIDITINCDIIKENYKNFCKEIDKIANENLKKIFKT